MRFSVWPSFERPWTEVLDVAQRAEAAGWHGLWYADHFMTDTPDGAPSDAPVLECWAVPAGLAASVPRLRLGSLVSPTTVHHPAVLAKRACTVDHISDGRLVLGIGAGWQVNEHRAYGIELYPPGERVGRFVEAIEILRGLLDQERTTKAGDHFSVIDAPCQPKALQQPLPIMVGASGPRMLRATARFADEWNTWGDLPQAAQRSAVFEDACEAVGRDPDTMRRSVQAMLFVTEDQAATDKLRERVPAGRCLVGSVPEIVDAMGRYAAMGFDEFIVPDFNLGASAKARWEAFERIREGVVAQVSA
jgi:alkanesulfonate monooxygenase SsuD/methylene tetrahydromethanopterin reductase-like flavin-dependent oxidoreductase (luciferase family)